MARKEVGLMQTELAERIGRKWTHISIIEIGVRRVDLVEFRAIAKAMGLDSVELFKRVYQPSALPAHLDKLLPVRLLWAKRATCPDATAPMCASLIEETPSRDRFECRPRRTVRKVSCCEPEAPSCHPFIIRRSAREELRDLDKPSHWHVGDGAEMVKRAASKNLAHWGRADQILPDL